MSGATYPITAILKTNADPELKLIAGVVAMALFDASQGDDDARDWLAQDVTPWLAWLAPDDDVRHVIEARLRAA